MPAPSSRARRQAHLQASRGALKLDLAARELGELPVVLLCELPLPVKIRVQHAVTKSIFEMDLRKTSAPVNGPKTPDPRRRRLLVPADAPTTDRSAREAALCSFEGAELLALAAGVLAERTFGSDLTAFALRKLKDSSFRVTAEHALAGAYLPPVVAADFTLGELLAALDLELTGIELGAEPATPALTAVA